MIKNAKKRSLSEGSDVTEKSAVTAKEGGKLAKKNKVETKVNTTKLEVLKKKQEHREKRKPQKKDDGQQHGPKSELSIEQIKERIQEIQSREALTKTARRKLGLLKKKLRIAEGTEPPTKEVTKTKNDKPLGAKKGKQVQSKTQNKQQKAKVNNKKDENQSNLIQVKPSAKDEEDDDDEQDDEDEEEDTEMDNTMEESEEEAEGNVDDNDEEEEEDESEDEAEDDDEDEDKDEDEDDENENETSTEVSPKTKPNGNKQKGNQESDKQKYVLYVRNLPFTITADELKKHFLTKVSEVINVTIPLKRESNTTRGFAYVEVANSIEHEKALALNDTVLKGRTINVQYSNPERKNNGNRNSPRKFKQGFQKRGPPTGNFKKNYQKNFGNKGRQNMKATGT